QVESGLDYLKSRYAGKHLAEWLGLDGRGGDKESRATDGTEKRGAGNIFQQYLDRALARKDSTCLDDTIRRTASATDASCWRMRRPAAGSRCRGSCTWRSPTAVRIGATWSWRSWPHWIHRGHCALRARWHCRPGCRTIRKMPSRSPWPCSTSTAARVSTSRCPRCS